LFDYIGNNQINGIDQNNINFGDIDGDESINEQNNIEMEN